MSSILMARKEKEETGELRTPGKKRKRDKPVIGQCDDFVKSAIRSKVHSFFFKNEPPTLNKVLACVNSDPTLPNLKQTTLHTILKDTAV